MRKSDTGTGGASAPCVRDTGHRLAAGVRSGTGLLPGSGKPRGLRFPEQGSEQSIKLAPKTET